MATKDDLASSDLYKNLMEEAKVRLTSINTLILHQRGIPSPLIREYCYLQLRMLCELIALGCLVAHNDIAATSHKSLRAAYAPKEILDRLNKLHSDFYPVPIIPQRTQGGWHMADYDRPYLTKSDLLALWGK